MGGRGLGSRHVREWVSFWPLLVWAQAVPVSEEGGSQNKQNSDLTKWTVNDSFVPNKIIRTQTREG